MAPRPQTEAQLVDRARGGDADAYADLVRRLGQLAFRTALVLSASEADAQDAAQEAFVKAWRALPRFRPGAPFRPWLLAIVANEARTRRRATGRREGWTLRVADELRASDAGSSSPETALLASERQGALLAALATLPAPWREVVMLRHVVGLDEAQAAAALGVRRGTVKSRLSRALDRLRTEVER